MLETFTQEGSGRPLSPVVVVDPLISARRRRVGALADLALCLRGPTGGSPRDIRVLVRPLAIVLPKTSSVS